MTVAEEAERAGFDLSLINASLRLSYDQRAFQHQQALNLMLELQKVGRKLRGGTQSAVSAPVRR